MSSRSRAGEAAMVSSVEIVQRSSASTALVSALPVSIRPRSKVVRRSRSTRARSQNEKRTMGMTPMRTSRTRWSFTPTGRRHREALETHNRLRGDTPRSLAGLIIVRQLPSEREVGKECLALAGQVTPPV
jgi:hypothetical protein